MSLGNWTSSYFAFFFPTKACVNCLANSWCCTKLLLGTKEFDSWLQFPFLYTQMRVRELRHSSVSPDYQKALGFTVQRAKLSLPGRKQHCGQVWLGVKLKRDVVRGQKWSNHAEERRRKEKTWFSSWWYKLSSSVLQRSWHREHRTSAELWALHSTDSITPVTPALGHHREQPDSAVTYGTLTGWAPTPGMQTRHLTLP